VSSDVVRPRTVTAAYLLWLICAVLLIFVALVTLTVPVDQFRTSLEDQGAQASEIDSYLTTIRVLGASCAVLGLALGFLAGPVRAGHARFRRILVGLSAVVAVMLLVAVLALNLFQELLVVVLVLIFACGLVYRPSARAWFARA
jgi:hypothetical protein